VSPNAESSNCSTLPTEEDVLSNKTYKALVVGVYQRSVHQLHYISWNQAARYARGWLEKIAGIVYGFGVDVALAGAILALQMHV
jgi:hypothetical protein